MADLHIHYDRLSAPQREAVDEAFKGVFDVLKLRGVTLAGDDRAERAVDALAAAILASEPSSAAGHVFPDKVRNIANGHDLYRVSAETFWNGATGKSPAPWIDSPSESYLLDPDRLPGMLEGYENALREVFDVVTKLDPDGRIRFVTAGPDVVVSRDHPIYVGARAGAAVEA